VKFQVKAIDNQASGSSEIPDGAQKDEANYLRQDLQARINKGPIKYEFYVQLQTDSEKTPLENAAKEWTEKDSMPIPVGEVEFFQGQNMNAPGAQELCEMTSFSPSHYVEGHKAIGNVNRGREVLYNFSGAQRNAQITSAEQVKKVYGPFPAEHVSSKQ
jgi:catalase